MPSKRDKQSSSNPVAIDKRDIIESRIDRIDKYVKQFDPSMGINQLRSRLTILEECWKQFEEIVDYTDSDLARREAFEDKYCDLTAKINNLIDEENINDNSTKGNSSPQRRDADPNNAIRLPKIDLIKFDGNLETWIQFHDTFNTLINTNNSLSKIQKFHYLKSTLKDEAAQIIQNLETTSENYDAAWELIKSRYENRRLIISKHVRSLFDIPKAEKQSAKAIRTLLQHFTKHLGALKALKQPTDSWDTLVVHLVSAKLDFFTLREWENSLATEELPTIKELEEFLNRKVQVLETLETSRQPAPPKISNRNLSNKYQISKSLHSSQCNSSSQDFKSNRQCVICTDNHPIYFCNTFKAMSLQDKLNVVKKHRLCNNCLLSGHGVSTCRASNCRHCQKPHNSVLCAKNTSHNRATDAKPKQTTVSATATQVNHACSQPTLVLLSTAVIEITDRYGNTITARALLDSGSQSNFVTESLAQRLGLKRNYINYDVTGIDRCETRISSSIQAIIKSRINNFKTTLDFLVISKISQDIPQVPIDISKITIPSSVLLADPQYHQPGKIDLLIGAGLFYEILHVGQIRLANQSAILQKTSFGWVVSGRTSPKKRFSTDNNTVCHLSIDQEPRLDAQIQRFWEIEDSRLSSLSLTHEERECEEHFLRTIQRDDNGRFVVTLPCNENISKIGLTRDIELKRFKYLINKLDKNLVVKARYEDFMSEYLRLGHMQKIPLKDLYPNDNRLTYYIPHHAVHKENSSTTKLRVVFDASAKSSSGISLNDGLMVGPVVQEELFSISLRFRKHKIVVTADVSKMYRQMRLTEEQYDFHRIFWWNDTCDSVQEYQLTTLTYGTSPASFIATRCLKKLGQDERLRFPIASVILEKDFYIDDLLTGFPTVIDTLAAMDELNQIFASAGMELRKWASNSDEVISHIPVEHREVSKPLEFDTDGVIKTLGLAWNALQDHFVYKISVDFERRITKRTALGEISRLFDPLGLVSPVVIRAKIFMQRAWSLKVTWDESLPNDLHTEWTQFRKDLLHLNSLNIPRNVAPLDNIISYEIQGFCDASESAYGGCIYLRCITGNGIISSRLVCAKSRVAPLKQTTIPRLELCGALLLAELYEKTINSLNLPSYTYHLWTDSTIVLGWLSTKKRLKTFVSNRVLQILDLTDVDHWHHVRTDNNPADCLSRGISTSELIKSDLWWYGPHWLSVSKEQWPEESINVTSDLPETKPDKVVALVSSDDFNLLKRFSKLHTLLHVTSYCLRFLKNCRDPHSKLTGPLTSLEITKSLHRWVKLIQLTAFKSEIVSLIDEKALKPKSKLKQLNPFLDEEQLLRVGGRLSRSSLTYGQKHPLVLPSNNIFTDLVITAEHLRLLHAGPQALLSSIRRNFWPLRGKDQVRRICHKCMVCFRAKPQDISQPMGNLPPHRVEPSRPFLRSGVDFCGPFNIRECKRKNSKLIKAYVAVFICFSTKAIHVELVSDLSTETFLAALRRFMGRRGKPSHIYSDNATNFVGSRNQLKELRDLFLSTSHKSKLDNFLVDDNIKWVHAPARSPHHGGLYEAAVKSLKYHLKRIVGNSNLTTEEFNTILIQVEGCLNSRPITALSSDPSDLSPLTPAHFLIGEEITATVEPDLQPLKLGKLSRWQLVQRLYQQFWKRWSSEYLGSLQQRSKWHSSSPNIKNGTLVLLKEDNLPPRKWRLGRITAFHPGQDGLVRVVSVHTSGGVKSRSIVKICPLPIEDE